MNPLKLFESVKGLVIEQYRESGNLLSVLESAIESLQPSEDSAERTSDAFDINAAEGAWLDIIGKIKNIVRKHGESDGEFRERLLELLKSDTAGTPDNVIANAADISGDPKPQYMDESPATFFVYTPAGRQIPRKKLQKLAPAGVLALPGAALRTVSGGDFIVTGEGKRILAVARDLESMGLVAETGELILTENGERIMTEGT
ncbi:DUF2612 domain-containing protein [Fibrobacter intestinalis]|uniref:Uncharacterized protein n=1 Tax=Fibrobacter intestinalis TaxID=28122 RepID=A0A1T4S5N1_9BACT|nr:MULTISPECIES: DUF2612 domain-containing protein [Fibrobacter]PBC72440.1 uncharacterized protein DUF2612 [Fibrobacter sp. NR9]PBC73045.1 uncharacterized protein DUF2612 [Fibrobacter sp. NR9]SKA15127.1 Protein of unknown function [Fibrobacter intestinalis]SKA23161.1 Protein of unknown function [Fibrobacter intestinalis]